MKKIFKVLRFIVIFIGILEILGKLGELGSNANQAGVWAVIIFWTLVICIALYFERKANIEKAHKKV